MTFPTRRTLGVSSMGVALLVAVTIGEKTTLVADPLLRIRLGPWAGATRTLKVFRHRLQPTVSFPWDRSAESKE